MTANVQLLNITPNSLEFIGRCAGICYNSSMESSSCVKRTVACKDKGHLATLRLAHATFHISNISRSCSHQFVRLVTITTAYQNTSPISLIIPSVS